MPAKKDTRKRSPRKCLRCNKTFPSLGSYNRICPICAQKTPPAGIIHRSELGTHTSGTVGRYRTDD